MQAEDHTHKISKRKKKERRKEREKRVVPVMSIRKQVGKGESAVLWPSVEYEYEIFSYKFNKPFESLYIDFCACFR